MLIALLLTANAGDLQAGWRGLAFGPAEVLDMKPSDDCDANPEVGIRWRCNRTVGAAMTVESYLVDGPDYKAVAIGATGYGDCAVLLDALNAAWGAYEPKEYATGLLADGFWGITRRVSASWSWNRFSGQCYAFVLDNELQKRSQERARMKAAQAAEAL